MSRRYRLIYRLEDIFKNDRKEYEEKWDNLKLFIEYGMLTEEKFCDRALKFALMKNTDGKFFAYDDYRKAIEAAQTDKDKKVVYLYATDPVAQYQYIETAKNKGYDVLLFDCQLDAHFVNLLETKEMAEAEKTDLSDMFESVLPEGNHYFVKPENLGENSAPILITQSEFMRRYRDMSALGGGMNFYGEMPESYTIDVNVQHPLIKRILEAKDSALSEKCSVFDSRKSEIQAGIDKLDAAMKDKKDEDIPTADKDAKKELEKEMDEVRNERKEAMKGFAKDNILLHQVVDLALLANNMLKGKDLSEFIRRSIEVL